MPKRSLVLIAVLVGAAGIAAIMAFDEDRGPAWNFPPRPQG